MSRILDHLRKRVDAPIERTTSARVDGLLEYVVPEWYRENGLSATQGPYGNGKLAGRLWVANRCQQMNAQQIASMPLDFTGPDGDEPRWVTDPDPVYFPNGIGDAMHYAVEQMYGWGYAILFVTDYYATGYPRSWTVLPSCDVTPCFDDYGAKAYKTAGGGYLDPDRVIQIDRNPGRCHGTSALRAYGALAYGLISAEQTASAVNAGAYPNVYLQPKRPISKDQAEAIQAQWMARTAERGGAPPVVPPDIEVKSLSINPNDLQLLESRQFDATAICTAYGVPSVLMNMALTGGMTYQNPAMLGEFWWRFELRNTATRFENALSNQMLPKGQYVTVRSDDTWSAAISPQDDPEAAVDKNTDVALTTPTVVPNSGGSNLAAVK